MPDPRGLRAAYIFPPGIPERCGGRPGDWVVYELTGVDHDIQRQALQRIRSRGHAVVTIMRQWRCDIRVQGGALSPTLWGGDTVGTFEVTPAGAAQATSYQLQPRDWVANVGEATAYLQLLPVSARQPPFP
eukprot:gene6852-7947_t